MNTNFSLNPEIEDPKFSSYQILTFVHRAALLPVVTQWYRWLRSYPQHEAFTVHWRSALGTSGGGAVGSETVGQLRKPRCRSFGSAFGGSEWSGGRDHFQPSSNSRD